MDNALLEELLNEGEGSSLDFKQQQYPFAGATDEAKSELLKDILAFANAWRRADAFILIGVEEIRGGRSVVHGITNHLGEQDIQQFVNSKTNRPIEFSYKAFPFEGKQVGILQIPVQERPFYLKNKYGRLDKNIVYIRRGSSTVTADVDEIARMGAANTLRDQVPALDLQFCDEASRTAIGKEVEVESLVLRLPERSKIPKAQADRTGSLGLSSIMHSVNGNYYREYAEYFYIRQMLRPICFVLNNTGSILLTNARLSISLPEQDGLRFYTESQLPDTPVFDRLSFITSPINTNFVVPDEIYIARRGSNHEISIDFGNVQPKAEALSDTLYLGAARPLYIQFEGVVFADNLSEPARISLSLSIKTQERSLSVDDLYKEIDDFNEERLRRFKEEEGEDDEDE